jgi:hypothetical protein
VGVHCIHVIWNLLYRNAYLVIQQHDCQPPTRKDFKGGRLAISATGNFCLPLASFVYHSSFQNYGVAPPEPTVDSHQFLSKRQALPLHVRTGEIPQGRAQDDVGNPKV